MKPIKNISKFKDKWKIKIFLNNKGHLKLKKLSETYIKLKTIYYLNSKNKTEIFILLT